MEPSRSEEWKWGVGVPFSQKGRGLGAGQTIGGGADSQQGFSWVPSPPSQWGLIRLSPRRNLILFGRRRGVETTKRQSQDLLLAQGLGVSRHGVFLKEWWGPDYVMMALEREKGSGARRKWLPLRTGPKLVLGRREGKRLPEAASSQSKSWGGGRGGQMNSPPPTPKTEKLRVRVTPGPGLANSRQVPGGAPSSLSNQSQLSNFPAWGTVGGGGKGWGGGGLREAAAGGPRFLSLCANTTCETRAAKVIPQGSPAGQL